ncbi:hypothetical protein H6P81_003879 [Aristolochia fimbriata]|uniref:Uncharacterized protein n=1 Tax=Aristolochia fimbriata TaxID=158543 RepID=A0AAV7FGT0_ARIFI|nr:hypothetical protein H6P81_003879 [Aristolochia fimbriata]
MPGMFSVLLQGAGQSKAGRSYTMKAGGFDLVSLLRPAGYIGCYTGNILWKKHQKKCLKWFRTCASPRVLAVAEAQSRNLGDGAKLGVGAGWFSNPTRHVKPETQPDPTQKVLVSQGFSKSLPVEALHFTVFTKTISALAGI